MKTTYFKSGMRSHGDPIDHNHTPILPFGSDRTDIDGLIEQFRLQRYMKVEKSSEHSFRVYFAKDLYFYAADSENEILKQIKLEMIEEL